MNYREYNPNQAQLFGYKPEDVLSEDHLAYLVDEMIENLDLKKFYDLTPGAGNPAYDPRLMLKVLFFGYATGVFSSRKLRQQCQENLAFIHLSRGQQPKFRAICEFRAHQQGHIKELFSQLLKIAKKLNILKIGRLVLDSTKIKGNASSNRTIKADKYDEVSKSIDDYLTNAQTQDSEEDKLYGKELTGQELPKELRSKSKRLQMLKEIIEEAKSKNLDYVNTTDPEANFMKDNGINKIKPSYSVQAGIDKDSGLIVACETCDTSADNEHLEPMIKHFEENTGIKPSTIDADSGYYSNASIASLEKEHVDTCIPDSITASSLRKTKVTMDNALIKYTRDDFKYDAQQNNYICPQGKILVFRREYEAAHNKNTIKMVKEYICKERCSNCPDAIRCLTHTKVKHRILPLTPIIKPCFLPKKSLNKKNTDRDIKNGALLSSASSAILKRI